MGRKSSAKTQMPPPAAREPKRLSLPALIAVLAAIAAAIGGAVYWQQRNAASQEAALTPTYAPLPADLKPHPQERLPPLELPAYQLQRAPEVIRAAYKFAAEHPEVLSYVPCFCGCERNGHRGNEDCFVRARDINGDVIEWEPHGMECAVCIDVATRAAALHASGAGVKDIRAAVERDWAGRSHEHTPTPAPPSN